MSVIQFKPTAHGHEDYITDEDRLIRLHLQNRRTVSVTCWTEECAIALDPQMTKAFYQKYYSLNQILLQHYENARAIGMLDSEKMVEIKVQDKRLFDSMGVKKKKNLQQAMSDGLYRMTEDELDTAFINSNLWLNQNEYAISVMFHGKNKAGFEHTFNKSEIADFEEVISKHFGVSPRNVFVLSTLMDIWEFNDIKEEFCEVAQNKFLNINHNAIIPEFQYLDSLDEPGKEHVRESVVVFAINNEIPRKFPLCDLPRILQLDHRDESPGEIGACIEKILRKRISRDTNFYVVNEGMFSINEMEKYLSDSLESESSNGRILEFRKKS